MDDRYPFFLRIGVVVAVVIRWHNRVFAYAFVLVTDAYPAFRLAAAAAHVGAGPQCGPTPSRSGVVRMP